ncbi:hypothetical protein J3R82DRAFT_8167 [Butyriboletus roseoflavus]|nr:hypothetical protein J3R82DRAFT_8167 [Butyriboletus roseoflavus]
MLRLSHLPRARSINVRYTAPGHANPYFLDRAHFIHPNHPAAKLALRNLPSFVCPQFTIRAFPNAILQEPINFVPINPLLATDLVRARTTTHRRQKFDIQQCRTETDTPTNGKRATWTTFHHKEGYRRWVNIDAMRRHIKFVAARQLADARLAVLAERGRRNVGLIFHTSKKTTSKSCVIRRRLRSKMTAAFDLVVSRSADAVDAPPPSLPRLVTSIPAQRPATSYPPLELVSRPLQESEHLVLQDWSYLVIPDLAIYKTPLPNIVQAIRKALLSLGHQSKRLESSWSALSKSHAPFERPHKVLTKSQTATQARTSHPHRLHPLSPASERAQGPDSSHEPITRKNVSTRLYLNHPIILPQGVVRK